MDKVKGDGMECKISISEEKLAEYMGRQVSNEDFANFCQDAVLSKLWQRQFQKAPGSPGASG